MNPGFEVEISFKVDPDEEVATQTVRQNDPFCACGCGDNIDDLDNVIMVMSRGVLRVFHCLECAQSFLEKNK
jgi:hypothetical protein